MSILSATTEPTAKLLSMPDEVSLSLTMLMTVAWCVSNWTEVSLLFWKQALTTSYVVVTDSVELLNLVGSCQLHSPWHCQPLWQFESKDKHGLFLRARWSCVSDWQLWPTRLCDNSSDDKLPADWMSLMPARCQNLFINTIIIIERLALPTCIIVCQRTMAQMVEATSE